jgi:hypothetical protein
MPVEAVRDNRGNLLGYRFGKKGKLYRGKGARAKAALQGRAIESRKHGS